MSILLRNEAETGSALAMYDLGRMYEQGLGVEADDEIAQQWYKQALATFQAVAASVPEKRRPYLWYRIGKMYAAGQGTEQNFTMAAVHFSNAVKYKHMCAAYSLAGLYYRGNGVEQNYETAFQLYSQSARKGNPYAQYEMAKMLRDGIGTEADLEQAEQCFRMAFCGFQSLERDSHDDKLQYRLGKLYLTGESVPKDIEQAISYFEQSAEQGNQYAQFFLDHLDSFRDPSAFLCATNLMHHLSNLIREDTAYKNAGGIRYQMDQKRRRKLLEKRRAQGQKGHIMESQQVSYQ